MAWAHGGLSVPRIMRPERATDGVLGPVPADRRAQRVETLPASQEIAERLKIEPSTKTVLRFCHRYVDDVPWSTQATYYPS